MEEAPLPNITPKESISELFEIHQDDKIYKLNIKIVNQDISLNISEEKDNFEEYGINLNFEELKQINKSFSILGSCQEFLEYIKALIKNNKLSIKKENENHISIEFIAEYLFKQNIVKISLVQKSINLLPIVKDMFKRLKIYEDNFKELKEENKNLKKENELLKKENKNINDKINNIQKTIDLLMGEIKESKNNISSIQNDLNQNLISKNDNLKINSFLIKNSEFNMIAKTIEENMDSKIKQIKKLYQATIDGGEPSIFHKKCDGIRNTLIIYQSKGNRRFGAFASESWETNDSNKSDKNCFLFSIDRKKIFSIKDNKDYFIIKNSFNHGPSFIHKGTYCIELFGNSFHNNSLRTVESIHPNIFKGESNELSEDGYYKGVSATDYEVFQIIFY